MDFHQINSRKCGRDRVQNMVMHGEFIYVLVLYEFMTLHLNLSKYPFLF
jgi:hypothetical protein